MPQHNKVALNGLAPFVKSANTCKCLFLSQFAILEQSCIHRNQRMFNNFQRAIVFNVVLWIRMASSAPKALMLRESQCRIATNATLLPNLRSLANIKAQEMLANCRNLTTTHRLKPTFLRCKYDFVVKRIIASVQPDGHTMRLQILNAITRLWRKNIVCGIKVFTL